MRPFVGAHILFSGDEQPDAGNLSYQKIEEVVYLPLVHALSEILVLACEFIKLAEGFLKVGIVAIP